MNSVKVLLYIQKLEPDEKGVEQYLLPVTVGMSRVPTIGEKVAILPKSDAAYQVLEVLHCGIAAPYKTTHAAAIWAKKCELQQEPQWNIYG